jgi:hypothetical protein
VYIFETVILVLNGEGYVKIQIMLVVWRKNPRLRTGRLPHQRDTSYALLVFLMLGIGLVLASVTMTAQAATNACLDTSGSSAGPPAKCNGSITIYAVVPAARPTRPAIITSPTPGQSFANNPINVLGTCQSKTIINIYTNGILVGSTICSASGTFSVPIDLVVGRNDLTALPFNTDNEAGPISPTVTVTLNQPPGGLGYSTQLLLQSQNYYQGTVPGKQIVWPIDIVGGQAPYAVDVSWGDGTSDLVTRLAPGDFTLSHTYKGIGTGYLNSFPLIIRATDAAGHTAYLQLTTIVNSPTAATSTGKASTSVNKLLIIWPLWIVLLLMIISFWLGERREKHIMQKRLEALA